MSMTPEATGSKGGGGGGEITGRPESRPGGVSNKGGDAI